MFVLVLAAENDETRQTVSFLIICLVGIAAALSALTVWYWLYTDPKRRRASAGRFGAAGSVLVDEPESVRGMVPVPDVVPATDHHRLTRPERRDEPVPVPAPAQAQTGPAGTSSVEDERSRVGLEAANAGAPGDPFVSGPLMAHQTWDFVAAAKRAEDRSVAPPAVVPLSPSVPRIAVPDRGRPTSARSDDDADEADELAVVRRRREREAARGLSDEVWQSVQRSVFDKLDG